MDCVLSYVNSYIVHICITHVKDDPWNCITHNLDNCITMSYGPDILRSRIDESLGIWILDFTEDCEIALETSIWPPTTLNTILFSSLGQHLMFSFWCLPFMWTVSCGPLLIWSYSFSLVLEPNYLLSPQGFSQSYIRFQDLPSLFLLRLHLVWV